jgi:hypothetical protein
MIVPPAGIAAAPSVTVEPAALSRLTSTGNGTGGSETSRW